VVVTDIRMPPSHTDEGLAIAARLRTERPDTGVVLLSQYAEATYALTLLAEGSARRATCSRSASPTETSSRTRSAGSRRVGR
jgi:DNA-binding NarL/FixJ family response regulator